MSILIYSEVIKPVKKESFKDLFMFISEMGYVVKELSDGLIKTNKEDIFFTRIDIDNSKNEFLSNVKDYRDELRASYTLLKKQGIPMGQEIVNALKEQLAFIDNEFSLKDKKNSKKEEIEKDIIEEKKSLDNEEII